MMTPCHPLKNSSTTWWQSRHLRHNLRFGRKSNEVVGCGGSHISLLLLFFSVKLFGKTAPNLHGCTANLLIVRSTHLLIPDFNSSDSPCFFFFCAFLPAPKWFFLPQSSALQATFAQQPQARVGILPCRGGGRFQRPSMLDQKLW